MRPSQASEHWSQAPRLTAEDALETPPGDAESDSVAYSSLAEPSAIRQRSRKADVARSCGEADPTLTSDGAYVLPRWLISPDSGPRRIAQELVRRKVCPDAVLTFRGVYLGALAVLVPHRFVLFSEPALSEALAHADMASLR